MEPTQVTAGITGQQGQQSSGPDPLTGLELDDFIKLLIAELQNQDPLSPLENSELLGQVSNIRQITATQELTDTLDAVQLGQAVASASNLIGKHITGLTDSGPDQDAEHINGVVDRVTITDGRPKLHVGPHTVSLNNVSQIEGSAGESDEA